MQLYQISFEKLQVLKVVHKQFFSLIIATFHLNTQIEESFSNNDIDVNEMTIVHRAPAGSTRPSCPNGPAWTGRSPSTHSRKAPPDASPRCTCPPETQPYTHTHDIVRTTTILYHNLNGEVDTCQYSCHITIN